MGRYVRYRQGSVPQMGYPIPPTRTLAPQAVAASMSWLPATSCRSTRSVPSTPPAIARGDAGLPHPHRPRGLDAPGLLLADAVHETLGALDCHPQVGHQYRGPNHWPALVPRRELPAHLRAVRTIGSLGRARRRQPPPWRGSWHPPVTTSKWSTTEECRGRKPSVRACGVNGRADGDARTV
jgi:hypothetical protein